MDYSTITCAACFYPDEENCRGDGQLHSLRTLPSSATPLNTSVCTDRCFVVECDKVEHVNNDAADFNRSDIVTICNEEGCEVNACGIETGNSWMCDQEVCFLDELLACNTHDPSTSCFNSCPQPQWPVQNCQYDPLKPSTSSIIHPAQHCNGPCNFLPSIDAYSSNSSPYDQYQPNRDSDVFENSIFCMWGDCRQKFSSQQDLLSHLQTEHLQPQLSRNPFRMSQPPPQISFHSQPETGQASLSIEQPIDPSDSGAMAPSFSCLWDNCNVPLITYDTPSFDLIGDDRSYPKFSDEFLHHLFQNHLNNGQQYPEFLSSNTTLTTQSGSSDADPSSDVTGTHDSQASPSTTETTSIFPRCNWLGCQQIFATSEELTAHIGDVHVGQGKKSYECFWNGCDRNGENAFPSKQKVMRHIQKHTGHKPYTCSVCNESFSEAASLQQHQRRHTQERPYVCDFPGCGKTFSFPGGLRIHKRGHSGEKPFKCPEFGCDKAFAESSNLAKHMRIHTGYKPFHCTHPGCGKRFGRKDQLLRHASMHRQGPLLVPC